MTAAGSALAGWSAFEIAAPELAQEGRRLLDRDGIDQALLATVRDGEAPRIHPIYTAIVDGRLYAFILGSAKLGDLDRDGRYALHTHQDPSAPSEFMVRGRARRVDDPETVARVAAGWYFEVDAGSALFEFEIESVALGLRDDPDEWPPRYSRWSAASG